MSEPLSQIILYSMLFPPLLMSLTIHEYAHARVAFALGDPTAYRLGRLTLNPLKHIDWLGFIMLVLVKFGWAKPVPINPYYFKSPRTGMLWVAIAGPASNFLVATVCALSLRYISPDGFLYSVIEYTMVINVYLAVFNLLPIPPLDGSRVVAGLLPEKQARLFDRVERYAPIFLGALFLYIQFVDKGLIRQIVAPAISLFDGLSGGH